MDSNTSTQDILGDKVNKVWSEVVDKVAPKRKNSVRMNCDDNKGSSNNNIPADVDVDITVEDVSSK